MKTKMKTKWKLLIGLLVLYCIGVIGFSWHTYSTIKALQANNPTLAPSLETLKVIFIMIGGLGVLAATFFNVCNSIESTKTIADRTIFDINENTFELLKGWDSPSLLSARKYSRDIKSKHKDLSTNELIATIEGNPDLKQSVILLCNYFEQYRVSIACGRVNKKILSDSMLLTFQDIFERFKPYIAEKFPAAIMSDLLALKNELEKA